MDCATEEAMIRGKLEGMAGVESLSCDVLRRRVKVVHDPEALGGILDAVNGLGFAAQIESADDSATAEEHAGPRLPRRYWVRLGVAGAAALAAEISHFAGVTPAIVLALSILAIALGGHKTYWKGLVALRHARLNINALMTVAVSGALIIGEWPEAAMVMVLFELAESIESLSLDRARHAIESLVAATPATATVRGTDSVWTTVPASAVAVGAIVRVAPGERVPLDGDVTQGTPTINQAPVTGESVPVQKETGDQVFAGTLNEASSFEFRVTTPAAESTLAHIVRAVEEAQTNRAPTVRFVDQFARYYTPAMFFMALAVAFVPPLAFGEPLRTWVYRALVLLVIGCPCALVISAPVTVVSGLARAARRGILVKGGAYLEEGRRLKVIAFDKTGTITVGRPQVTDFAVLNGDDDGESLLWAASVAAHSNHPVSRAVVEYAHERGLEPVDVHDVSAIAGRGVRGWLNGEWLYLGNHALVEEQARCSIDLEQRLEILEREGKTVAVLASEHGPIALFAVADAVRPASSQALAELGSMGVRTVMLSGDNPPTVAAIAAQVGINDARGGLLPDAKLQAVHDLRARHGQIGMAGDGINDAPALATADIGFSMGVAGSATALETADVALMDDDLRKIPEFIRLSRRTGSVLVQNVAFALGIKAVFFALAVAGEATLWMAVIADMGVSLLVVFNGLRLLRDA